MKSPSRRCCILLSLLAALPGWLPAQAVKFRPPVGEALEVWRITHDPAVRDHANYHNTQCWSPDGRHLAFTRYAADAKEYGTDAAAEIRLFDFAANKEILVERGLNPRWANQHSWLIYNRLRPAEGLRNERGTQLVKLDVVSGAKAVIGYGVGRPTMVSHDDQFIYGIWYPANARSGDGWEPYEGEPKAARFALREGAQREILRGDFGVGYNSLLASPGRPVVVTRDHHFRTNYFATPGTTDIPFKARHFRDMGLAGENLTPPFPCMDGAHFAWSGDGEWFLPGNGPLRGRKWNEPFPANVHFLSNIAVGDIGPAGRSGRWVVGSTGGGNGAIRVADLRSGDGWIVMPTHSFLCSPSGRDNSGPYDNDAKGSPDGTKIAFVSTYDLQHGPAAGIVEGSTEDEIRVDSTAGFPESGELVNPSGFGGEVIGYRSKTPNTFRGLRRGLHGTNAKSPLRTDRMLTLLDHLLLPKDQRTPTPLRPRDIRELIKEPGSPLLWQRSSKIHVAVVRLPDRPHLRIQGHRVELIPGENHWETRGYRILRNGNAINRELAAPGQSLTVQEGGTYTAVAVEWSGLESKPGLPLEIPGRAMVAVLRDAPADFSWTTLRWVFPDGRSSNEAAAKKAPEAVRETVHLHDGVIQRQVWRNGHLARQDDLNGEGRPIRRLNYEAGRLATREFLDREGNLVSTEWFGADGFITRSAGQRGHSQGHPAWKRDGATTFSEWFYERGVPVRYVRGTTEIVRVGDRYVLKK
jgi:hypothetical protein